MTRHVTSQMTTGVWIRIALASWCLSTATAQTPSAASKPLVRTGAPVERAPLPKLPPLKPLFDYPIRDTSICVGHDGAYYLTGTTGAPDWWATFFGNDARASFRERPAALRIEFLPDGRFTFATKQPDFVLKK
jgi:hypothetical protein